MATDDESEYWRKQEEFVERQLNRERAFLPNEFRRRVSKIVATIPYIPILAFQDVTKYEKVRKCRFIDGIEALKNIYSQARF